MKKALSFVLLLTGLTLLPTGANAQRRAPADEGVRAELQKMADAWNAANLTGHVAPYADSATMMGGRGPIVGRDTIQAALKRSFWRDNKPTQRLRFEQVAVRPLGERHALATGHFILTAADGKETGGWFTTVWQLSEGRWRIIHDHSS